MTSDNRNPIGDIPAACRRAAAFNPSRIFLHGPEPLTYGKLLDRMARLGDFFRSTGLPQGSRVIIATRDDVEAVVLFLALLSNGLTAVMIDPLAPADEAARLIPAAEAHEMFIDAELHDAWSPPATGRTVRIRKAPETSLFSRLLGRKEAGWTDSRTYPALLEHCSPQAGPQTVPPDTDAYILFTSGTTSRPKGVRISQGALGAHLGTLVRQFGYTDGSRILNTLPLHHADGMIQGPVVAFCSGAGIYRPMQFSIQALPALLDTVYAERITHFVAVPTILALMLKVAQGYEDCFSSDDFRCVVSTAAYLDQALWDGFESRFGVRVANVYGLTETVAGSFFSGPDDGSHRPGTVGRPVDCQARITAGDGNDLPDGETGELLLAGTHLMTGYFNDPDATAESLRDGWLRTGDLAVRDGEGYYRIVGRKKNIIISGGLNIHPEEVTECLSAHPGVLEAVTFGVPDETWGERVVSCAVPSGAVPPTEGSLVEYLRGRLTAFKVPGRIHVVAELPKGPSGKVIIDRARKLVADVPAMAADAAGGETRERIVALAARCFKVPIAALSVDACQAVTPGWDSLAHLEFMVAIEQEFDIRLSPADIIRIVSLKDAERIVEERLDA